MKENLTLPYTEQPIFIRLLSRYMLHDIGRSAAALAYYFLFSMFPALILVTMLLTWLKLPPLFMEMLKGIVPQDILDITATYMEHINQVNSGTKNFSLFLGSILLLFYFTMRAMNCVIRTIRTAYGYKSTKSPLRQQLNLFAATFLMMIGILVSLILINVGRRVLHFLSPVLHLTSTSIDIWNLFRFVILAVILFSVLFLIYYLVPGRVHTPKRVLPGTFLAMFSWLAFSVIYAFYVENINNYSLLYGTLGAVIVLLLWLYFSGFVLILGAEVNGIYLEMRSEMRMKKVTVPQWKYLWLCGWDLRHPPQKPHSKNHLNKK
ncbi:MULTISPECIES: YihY/virulence factor BrkB family protein [Caproicibacterium]|uniref:YihY/virulence factor BrkB family protein n=1 Tax=Caproicibacterium argilliputei TaxID=3030016 RepID=A0AA97D817_9FIRM|nr:YihY/virulence factor BrkB family protein [Caproicibacterium argilliputei]WOC31362.1 YihY/virulence factor BrkB family protein [Caproicibacterium argilliputei]